jgi:glycerol kinase
MLMDVKELKWDENMCKNFGVPMETLPTIKSCSELFGVVKHGALKDIPITG